LDFAADGPWFSPRFIFSFHYLLSLSRHRGGRLTALFGGVRPGLARADKLESIERFLIAEFGDSGFMVPPSASRNPPCRHTTRLHSFSASPDCT
jgi:hypothetical protein